MSFRTIVDLLTQSTSPTNKPPEAHNTIPLSNLLNLLFGIFPISFTFLLFDVMSITPKKYPTMEIHRQRLETKVQKE